MNKFRPFVKYSSVAIFSSLISFVIFEKNSNNQIVKAATLVPNTQPFTPTFNRRYLDVGVPEENTRLKFFEGYIAFYDKKHRIPLWVMEHLPGAQMNSDNGEKIERLGHEFYEDLSEDPLYRSRNSDYFRSGYDRGHMAAAGNHRFTNKSQYSQTFNLVNIAPQVGDGFNRHPWNQLERYVRNMASKSHDLYCITGSLFIPEYDKGLKKKFIKFEVIGDTEVSVPTHFYKAVAFKKDEKSQWVTVAWLMPNERISTEKIDLNKYQVPLSKIEAHSGYRLFREIR